MATPRRLAVSSENARGFFGIGTLDVLARMLRVGEKGDATQLRHYLAQQLNPLGGQLGRHQGQSGHVGMRPGEAVGEAGYHRIAAERVDHGDRQIELAERETRRALGDDHIDRYARHFGSEFGNAFKVVVAVPQDECEVAAFDITQIGEAGAKRFDIGRQARCLLRRYPANAGNLRSGLGRNPPWQDGAR